MSVERWYQVVRVRDLPGLIVEGWRIEMLDAKNMKALVYLERMVTKRYTPNGRGQAS